MFVRKRKIRMKSRRKKASSERLRRPYPRFKRFQGFKKVFKFLFVIAIFVAIFYIFAFSNRFVITELQTQENSIENETTNKEIKSILQDQLGKNLAFTSTSELENKVIEHFPAIQKITITKDYPNTLKIKFNKFSLVANVIHESSAIKKSYIINSIGYIAQENLENTRLPYIKLYTEQPANPKLPLIETTKLEYILNAVLTFEERFGMKVLEVEYKKTARELHLYTEKEFTIWLDVQQSLETQFRKLKKSLVKLDIYKEPLDYIDLRIAGTNGDKIIYKRK